MITVNVWESLVLDTKFSILVALGVLDFRHCGKSKWANWVSRMSVKLDILVFGWNLFKGDTVVGDFKIIDAVVLKR